MRFKDLFVILVAFFFIGLLFIYWFLPFDEIQFGIDKNPSFSLEGGLEEMQFYKNMRFPGENISYSIDESCSLQKKFEMTKAFENIEDITIVQFYPVGEKGQIIVSCDEKDRIEGRLFVAGEGGPTNITAGENFNVILAGQIMLIRDSKCENPNIAIHELLHVLGFSHSTNRNNIMYPVSKCSQTIGNEIPNKINELYSYPQLPDLAISDVSASISGRYMDVIISIKNEGLKESSESKLIIYGEGEPIKEMELAEIKIGYGINITLTNIWVSKRKIGELMFSIESSSEELSKENNQILLTKKYD